MTRAAIVGTGSYIPEVIIKNDAFLNAQFFDGDGKKIYQNNKSVIEKFKAITGIEERRYARQDQRASDLALLACKNAIEASGTDKETIDYIIAAHNFGDVAYESNRVNLVPSIAARVKAMLEINNPDCIAYDLPFGCPGWIEAVIHANLFIQSGQAKRCLVVGTETLSRIIDPHDRDSMLFGDGSGAVLLEGSENNNVGILAHKTQSFATAYAELLNMGSSYKPFATSNDLFIKMQGRKVYEFALSHVPTLIKDTLDKAKIAIEQVSKILIHQANEKMDHAILDRVFRLFGKTCVPEGIAPMTIGSLGNSSVATVPTLLDLVRRGKLEGHSINPGDHVVFASVGAGMNINALVCRF